ncbi:MAG: hypothetical protein K2X34_03225 [Hyphomonadaceae bacterium]|nr:hypothetical protein [Hyphomonadaceae bacterium]
MRKQRAQARGKRKAETDPIAHLASQPGAEIVALADIEPGQRGRAVRVRRSWPLETHYRKGRLPKRCFDAAVRLSDLADLCGFDRLAGTRFCDRVDGGGQALAGPPGAGPRARYLGLMAAFPSAQRRLIEAVVVDGADVTAAAMGVEAGWLPADPKRRAVAAWALMVAGLESLADAMRI